MTPESGRLAVYDAPGKPFEIHRFPVQVDLGRVDAATTELNLVVEMDPKNLEGLILLGKVSQMPARQPDGTTAVSRASLERAELNLEAAATLAPQNAEVKSELASVRAKLAELKNRGEKK